MWILLRAFPHPDEDCVAPEAVAIQRPSRLTSRMEQTQLAIRQTLLDSPEGSEFVTPADPIWLGYDDVERLEPPFSEWFGGGPVLLPAGTSLMACRPLPLNRTQVVYALHPTTRVLQCWFRGWSESGRDVDSLVVPVKQLLECEPCVC